MTDNPTFIPQEVLEGLRMIFKSIFPIAFLILFAFLIIFSIRYFGHDNPIEELTEEVIHDQLDINIDLTPNTKE